MNSIGSLYFLANINVNWNINFDSFKKKIEKTPSVSITSSGKLK